MKKFIQNKLKDQKGLTLIELLAVIVIIAIIAAIAIPAIGNIIENSRVGAVKSDAINVLSAATLYETDGNKAGTDGTVTVTALKTAGYLDDLGEIPGAATVHIANKTISGTANVTGAKVEFKTANKATINSMPNNQSGTFTPTSGTGTIEVTR
ncbi:prepilin-type N-terminal cleavage/methylation domain-containing protein [Planococcus ruber]|uniref:prepilin-type N-terminal cleavage/methylation domain-containing protein n=1 Tax=Planococcus ruber TaxID=2027871 RepID=UPI001FEED73A|nr:prepilin-type N-terminal cleavage/methylation domain-containing protein [Planococcus ruber]MCJ1908690.1 prepilin-type N-terminal cleavage/methylation domain-containing protein [Planococcus ruber]